MLDFELAEIYGYETKTFQLTKDEWEFLRSKILTPSRFY